MDIKAIYQNMTYGPSIESPEFVFKWLEKCETEFGFDEKKSYSQIRIYAFLAERFLSYWFKKNSNFHRWPIKHFEI